MFSGIEPWQVKDRPGEFWRGSTCLRHWHTRRNGSAYVLKMSETKAFLECVEEINQGYFLLD